MNVQIDKGYRIEDFGWKHQYNFSFLDRLEVDDSFVINNTEFCQATNWSAPYPSIESIRQRIYHEMKKRGYSYASRAIVGTKTARVWRTA